MSEPPYVAVAVDPFWSEEEPVTLAPSVPIDHAAIFSTLIPLASIAIFFVFSLAHELHRDAHLSVTTTLARRR